MSRRRTLIRISTFAALAIALSVPALQAQEASGASLVAADEVEWTEIIPGVRFGAVYGQWDREAHGKLISFDPGVRTPMHVHSGAYHGVVIRGEVTNPYASDEEEVAMGPGTYWYVPGGAPHVTACVSEEPCLFYTHADGAWDIEVVEGS